MSEHGNILTDSVRATRRLGHYFVEKLHYWELQYQSPGNQIMALKAFDEEWSQLEHTFETLAPLFHGDTQIAEICAHLPIASPSIFGLRLPGEKWAEWLNVAVSATEQLDDWNRSPTRLHHAQLQSCLGNAYIRCRRFRDAAGCLKRAVLEARDLGDAGRVALWTGNLAVALAEDRQLGEALQMSEAVISMIGTNGDQRLLGDQLRLSGTIHFDNRNFRKALEVLFEALRIHSIGGNGFEVGTDLGEIGLAFAGMGDFRRAREYLTEARDISREVGSGHSESIWQGHLNRIPSKTKE